MIKRFHALYVGQIELDNIGLNGTPANERRYPNERLSEVFQASLDVARVMDELGYYCFWGAEHHFQHEGYECIPNLIQWGLWLATQTKRLKFGSAFNLARCFRCSEMPRPADSVGRGGRRSRFIRSQHGDCRLLRHYQPRAAVAVYRHRLKFPPTLCQSFVPIR